MTGVAFFVDLALVVKLLQDALNAGLVLRVGGFSPAIIF